MTDEIVISNEIQVGDKIVKMFGECVAVCWATRKVKKTLNHMGVEFSATVCERANGPYIDFMTVNRDVDSGEFYADEDSPVDGGLSVEMAEQVFVELGTAIKYLRELEAKHE